MFAGIVCNAIDETESPAANSFFRVGNEIFLILPQFIDFCKSLKHLLRLTEKYCLF